MSQENFIFYGGISEFVYNANNKTLGEYILKSVKANGNKIALIDGITGESITYDRLLEKTFSLVKYLQGKGIGIGDTIGLCCENCIEFPIVVFATIFCGATLSTISPRYVNLCKDALYIKEIIQIGQNSEVSISPKIQNLDDILRDPKNKMDEEEFNLPVYDKIQNDCVILMSSGTTGLPKGVVLTDFNILDSFENLEELKKTMLAIPNVRSIGVLPWFHSYGLLTLIFVLTKGVKFIGLPRFEEKTFLNTLQTYKVNHAFLVPPLIIFLAKNPNVKNYDLSNLKEVNSGAAPLGAETQHEIKQRLPSLTKVQQTYGMTETTLAILGTRGPIPLEGSVGKIMANNWCKVIDAETGEILGPNKRGELCFKGGSVMKGYYRNPKATKETIKDGWLHTGDIGYYDEHQNFYVVDRIKELIKYNGFQVAPAELEDLLLTHPAVKDAAVIGKPDQQVGELPTAFVALKDNFVVSEEEIVNFVADQVSNPKKLRGGVHFIPEIPKNASGKLLRRVLREMLVQPKAKL